MTHDKTATGLAPDGIVSRLGEIKIRAALATPAPLKVGVLDPELDPVQLFREHLEAAVVPSKDVWVVWCPEHPDSKPDPEGRPQFSILAAITGNGPTSEANAEFFAHARDDVPWLLYELDRLRSGWKILEGSIVEGQAWVLVAPQFIRQMLGE